MKILVDPQTYNEQKFGGISRYHTELYLAHQKVENITISCPLLFSDNLHLKEASLFQNYRNTVFESKLIPKFIRKKILKRYKKKNLEATVEALEENNFDVFIPTYYNPYFLEKLNYKPFVLTLHDMIHELFPHYFTRDLHTVKNKKILLEKATKVIAVSYNTKKDILKIYPHIDASKIEVVYLAHSVKTDQKAKVNLPKAYILFVGNRKNYKNFLFFIKAVAPILNSHAEMFIVAAGGNKFTKEEHQWIKKLGISNQILQQNFEDHELATYYSRAKCFVFPSEYEGFGIPVLESMACGCPIVLANHSSFPEVAGEAGVYFELNNESDLKDKVLRLIEDEDFREKHVRLGLEQVQKFNWQKTADECLEVYRKAVV
ncbi:glycosyltransferase family 1 protein [Flavobacterium sp.]|uniref:glycosyltransferase family 4 protein n=1 Tax=Flavobacterium sp. TaxID=239 RepID=UPI0026246676|nr:glycosyltransferase family 1 protein [Flavobacterium sp.]